MLQRLEREAVFPKIRRATATLSRNAISFCALAITSVVQAAIDRKEFAIALAATLIAYFPALKNGSADAGLLYMGDVLGFYWPALAKIVALLASFNFTGIDFSSYNGSADFSLTPNLFSVHPFFVAYSLLSSPWKTSIGGIGHLLVIGLALHSFIACYYTSKLLTRFFHLELPAASFAAIAFSYAGFTIAALSEPPFLFCASVIPWIVYSALEFQENPTFARLILACMPVLMTYFGGYLPIGFACLALSCVIIASKIVLFDESTGGLADHISRLIMSAIPTVVASVVASPYLLSAYLFHAGSPSSGLPSLFYSAHQMAEMPQGMLRILSHYLTVPGPVYEFTPRWGFIAVTITFLFLLSSRTADSLTLIETRILKVCGAIYAATFLSIYGQSSVVSDLIYNLIPQIGKMHIYQRFLLPANLMLAIAFAIMLKPLVVSAPQTSMRIALGIFAIGTLSAAYVVGHNPALTEQIGLNNSVVMELCLCLLFVMTLVIPGRTFKYVVAIILINLPALGLMYNLTSYGNTLTEQQKLSPIALNQAEQDKLLAYLKQNSTKDLVKYIDITPMWTPTGVETFPKSFPYATLGKMNLSSYGGFDFYQATRADYMATMPVGGNNVVMPNWDYVTKTGADFLVAMEADLKDGKLAGLIDSSKAYRLPNDAIIAPLVAATKKDAAADNGYFRISDVQPSTETKPNILNFTTNNANYLRVDIEAARPAIVEYLLWPNPRLSYYVDGQRVTPSKRDGLIAFEVGAGHKTIEIYYRHWPLTIFWIFYAALGVAWIGACLSEIRKQRPECGYG